MRWLLVFLVACRTQPAVPEQDASVAEASDGFGASECAACLARVCAPQEEACASDPVCASYLACVTACPVGADGSPDPECEGACPGLERAKTWRECRSRGEGSWCKACTRGWERYDSGILTQKCDGVVIPEAGTGHCYDPVTPKHHQCRNCRFERCCQTITRCREDPECLGMQRCFGCGFDFAVCAAAFPRGIPRMAPDFACTFQRCLEECTDGPVDPCVSCLVDRCGDERAAYEGSADGFRHHLCVSRCRPYTIQCQEECTLQYPSVRAALDRYDTCTLARCGQRCLE